MIAGRGGMMLIHGFVGRSRVNGPGVRAVVYFQGCTLGCRCCWNADTHSFIGEERTVGEVVSLVQRAHEEHTLEGIAFSGGEPMQQAPEFLALVELLHNRLPSLSFSMYSGYSQWELDGGLYWCRTQFEKAEKQQIWRILQVHLDFAVLGRYVASRPSVLPLRTSTNQTLTLFSKRYCEEDFEQQGFEIQIDAGGLVQVTGFPVAGLPIP